MAREPDQPLDDRDGALRIGDAQAAADQKIVQSKRAVEIETLKAQAEVQPIVVLAEQLTDLKSNGPGALDAYVRNLRLTLFSEAKTVILEASHE